MLFGSDQGGALLVEEGHESVGAERTHRVKGQPDTPQMALHLRRIVRTDVVVRKKSRMKGRIVKALWLCSMRQQYTPLYAADDVTQEAALSRGGSGVQQ